MIKKDQTFINSMDILHKGKWNILVIKKIKLC